MVLKVGEPLSLDWFEIPSSLEPGAALCRVRMSTVCGSDLHTVSGRRKEPMPIILGHEIIGDVVALGQGWEALQIGCPDSQHCQTHATYQHCCLWAPCPQCKTS